MGNFTASEILTVIVVILIVFGPNRLPELARKAGSLAASARRAMESLKGELSAEYGDVISPLRDARNELRSAGTEIRGQVAEIGKEVSAAGNEIKDVTKQALGPDAPDAGGPSDSTNAGTAIGADDATASAADPLGVFRNSPGEKDAPTGASVEDAPKTPPETTGTDDV